MDISLIIMLLFVLLELFIQNRPIGFLKKGFWVDFLWFTFVQGLILQYLVFRFIDKYYEKLELNWLSNFPIIIQFFVLLIIIEFVAYWLHRFSHSNWYMWRMHEVHHSSLELNWLSGSRNHFTSITLVKIIYGAIFALSGASLTSMYIFMAFNIFMAAFTHSNVKVKIGYLKYFFNSPQMHFVHHANRIECQSSNFGDKLTLWDWVFGTAKELTPEELEQVEFGVGYPYPQDFIGLNFYLFRKRER